MEFNSLPCTSKEQSERLISIGIKAETADMCWHEHYGYAYPYTIGHKCQGTPAWSMDRLIEILKHHDRPDDYQVSISVNYNRYDELISLIQSLIHINLINEKYLNMDIVNKRESENIELLKQ